MDELTVTEIPLPLVVKVLLAWFKHQPVFGGLIALMIMDILVGTCLSIVRKTLSSAISWRGMSRKVIMLLLVGASGVIQQFVPSFPFLNVVSSFYVITETISILENAAAAGVPLPKNLVETLIKLREQQRVMSEQKLPAPAPGTTTVNNYTTVVPARPVPVPMPIDSKTIIITPNEPTKDSRVS